MARSVEICMITTPDGVIDVNGRSAPLGGPADQARLLAFRDAAAMVLVGAGTVRAEGYGAPSRSDVRIGVVTATCALDFSTPLFTSGAGVVITAADAPQVPIHSVRAGHGSIDFAGIISQLPEGFIHVEGGPQLNASLLEADLVDAINLTVTAQVGGVRGVSLSQAPHALHHFSMESVTSRDNFVFVRYVKKKN